MNTQENTCSPDAMSSTESFLNRNWVLLANLLVLLATFAAYAPSLRFNFAYDDFPVIVYNERIHSAKFMGDYFTQEVWGNSSERVSNLYRPLFLGWLLANYKLFGLAPEGWHLTGILLHLVATWLVFRLARALLGKNFTTAAVFAAGVFGLHPIHVEGVSWICGVTEPLCACMFLGSFLSFFRSQTRNKTATTAWLIVSVVLFAAALGSKETAIVLPALIACCLMLLPAQGEVRTMAERAGAVVLKLIPYLIVIALYLVMRWHALHGLGHTAANLPVRTSALLLPWALYFYIRQLFTPIGLGPFYDIETQNTYGLNQLAVPVLVLALLAICLWQCVRKTKSRQPLFLLVWFLMTLAPAFSIVMLMSRYEAVHDRYLYLPSVAFAVMAGYVWERIRVKLRPLAFSTWQIAASVLVLAGLAYATNLQTRYWQNDLVLFTRACAIAPQNSMARLNLAAELIRRRRFQESLTQLQTVIARDANLGVAYSLAGKSAFYQKDYAAAESYIATAVHLQAAEPENVYYLAMSQINLGRAEQALAVLQKASALWPKAPLYHYASGEALATMGRWHEARDQYRQELELHPDIEEARSALAEADAHLQLTGVALQAAKSPKSSHR